LSDGTTLEGSFKNKIGHGYSPLDGFGFINAQAAVQAVQYGSLRRKVSHDALAPKRARAPEFGSFRPDVALICYTWRLAP
jgi:hypothetical protein